VLNDDGVSVLGCHHIYAPKGQALEYSALAANPYRGCGHGCKYCYVPLITRQDRKEFDSGAVMRDGFLDKLERDALRYQQHGIEEQVMMSFTTDPYHPGVTATTGFAIEILHRFGLAHCTLTKGGSRALRDIDLFRPKRDAFASTLTSLDATFSRKWERNAADPDDRIATLKAFHDRGIFTWVSLEPTLDIDSSLAIVDATHWFVDLYKIGRANYVPTITKVLDWRLYTLMMLGKLTHLGAKYYFKKDLQPHLPKGIINLLRVPQHH
jgi:DNA repair photolyase